MRNSVAFIPEDHSKDGFTSCSVVIDHISSVETKVLHYSKKRGLIVGQQGDVWILYSFRMMVKNYMQQNYY